MSNSVTGIFMLLFIAVGFLTILALERDKTRRHINSDFQEWYQKASDGIRVSELNPEFDPAGADEHIDTIRLNEPEKPAASSKAKKKRARKK